MLSYKMDFSFCACKPCFVESYIPQILSTTLYGVICGFVQWIEQRISAELVYCFDVLSSLR